MQQNRHLHRIGPICSSNGKNLWENHMPLTQNVAWLYCLVRLALKNHFAMLVIPAELSSKSIAFSPFFSGYFCFLLIIIFFAFFLCWITIIYFFAYVSFVCVITPFVFFVCNFFYGKSIAAPGYSRMNYQRWTPIHSQIDRLLSSVADLYKSNKVMHIQLIALMERNKF